MNPPFEQGQDAEHVMHTFSLLNPGGILAAIVSTGLFARSDKKTLRFRNFLETTNAVVHDVPAGSFKSCGTGTETKILCIRSAPSTNPANKKSTVPKKKSGACA